MNSLNSKQWKRYPKYKDSGVEWLGEIPESWGETRIKYEYEICLGKMLQSQPLSSLDTLEFYLRAASIDWDKIDISDIKEMWFSPYEKKMYKLRYGDLIISEGGDVGKAAIWQNHLKNCYIQNAVHRVRHKKGYSNKFLYYWLFFIKCIGYIDLLCNKATIAHFTVEKVKEVPLFLPTLHEQEKIAQFLDRETAKIDTLINKKQRLIELLKEKRTAIISHAVTKGLNPDVPMKDSGVEWLGTIPEHWGVSKAKLISSIFVPQRNKPDLNTDDGIPWITMDDLISPSINLSLSGDFVSQSALFKAGSKILPKECIIASCVGNLGVASVNIIPVVINQQLQAYVPNRKKINIWFYRYCVISSKIYFEQVATSTTLVYVNQTKFGELSIVLPSLSEQQKIAEYLDTQTQKIDTLIYKTQTSIEYLKEYRTALISAAVTGKIDVRGGSNMTEKPIVISTHARQQMNLRGAKELEVITAIRTGTKRTAQKDRFRSRCEFDFNSISPINNQLYSFKAIEAIFSENTAKITVITVLVYYYN